MNTIRWGKAILNGLLAWLIGFILYMIPSFVVAFGLAFGSGAQTADPAAMSQQISQQIAAMYQGSWLLSVGLIVVTGLLVLWRAWAVAKGSGQKRMFNGLIVGAMPAALTLLFLACGGLGWLNFVAMLLYLGVGVAGGYLAKT